MSKYRYIKCIKLVDKKSNNLSGFCQLSTEWFLIIQMGKRESCIKKEKQHG